jgi:hypothetical protein
MHVAGTNVFIGDSAGNLMVYELMSAPNSQVFLSPEPRASTTLPDEPIIHVSYIKCYMVNRPLLVPG